jgi:multisubunit Na+/H+ antiporter MnhG subunit
VFNVFIQLWPLFIAQITIAAIMIHFHGTSLFPLGGVTLLLIVLSLEIPINVNCVCKAGRSQKKRPWSASDTPQVILE